MTSRTGRLRGPVRALSFDAYGTLLQGGTDDLVTLLDGVRARHNLPLTTKDLLREREGLIARLDEMPFLNMSARDRWILSTLFERHGIKEDVEPHVRALHQAHLDVVPYPGIPEALKALDLLPRVLVTNADVDMMDHVLKRTGLRFDAVVTSESVQAYKPTPILFTTALKHVGVPPGEVLHVGDSFVADIVGAARAGMQTCWVTKPTGLPKREGETVQPDLTVGSVAELPALLR
ncbi:MAG TPA: HAD family hydrolase [Candidatus Thermoplasmatota archaeon]|nr:HAD family hydrolase [Candidatus Thermoplasmatota archaeon]